MPQGMGKQKAVSSRDLQVAQLAQALLGFLRVQLVLRVLGGQEAPGDLGFPLVLVHPEVR